MTREQRLEHLNTGSLAVSANATSQINDNVGDRISSVDHNARSAPVWPGLAVLLR